MSYFILEENIERRELDIVLIGSFNPTIITPLWLSNKSLIRESDSNTAVIRLIHSEISDFDLDWVSINVTQKRFHIRCTKEPFFELTRDLIVGIFSYLKETPITSFGYNYNFIINLKSKERHYEFGNKLSPLINWNKFMDDPRMQRLEIIEMKSKQKSEGSISTIIFAVPQSEITFGAGITINDHYNFSIEKDGLKFSYKFLMDYWANSILITQAILSNLSISLQL